MGEIAEMMLDGTLCEACGEFIGDESGFPQYCSRQCAAARGMACDNPKPKKTKAKKARQKAMIENEWLTVKNRVQDFATINGLTVEFRNPNYPTFQIAALRGEGVRLVVYPHTTTTTGNKHARIRNEGSTNPALARSLMIASGFSIKIGGLPKGDL